MAELGVLFVLNAVLEPDKGIWALQSRLHFESIELVHVVDLLSIFVSSDDEPCSFFVVDRVPHASHFHRNLIGPAILNLNEHPSHYYQARSLVDHTVRLIHDKQAISAHFASEISFDQSHLFRPGNSDRSCLGHRVLRREFHSISRFLSHSDIGLIKSELSNLRSVLVGYSRSLL